MVLNTKIKVNNCYEVSGQLVTILQLQRNHKAFNRFSLYPQDDPIVNTYVDFIRQISSPPFSPC